VYADPFRHTPTSTPRFLRIPFSTLATQFRLHPPINHYTQRTRRGQAADKKGKAAGTTKDLSYRIASHLRVYTSSASRWFAPSRLLISSLLQLAKSKERRAHDKESPKKHRTLLGLNINFFLTAESISYLPSFLPVSYCISFCPCIVNLFDDP
jgi:hypothetical protein